MATIQLSNGMTEIQEGTIFGYRLLTSVSFSKNLKAIRKMAFKDCKSIENFLLPEYLETIEDSAFSYCWAIKKATVTSNIRLDPSIFSHSFKSDRVEIIYMKKPVKS